MSEDNNCCVFHEEREKDIRELYKVTDNLNFRVSELEKGKAVTDEQVKMIFKILEEIKTSVGDIASEIKNLKEKPSIMMYSIGSGVVVGIIVAAITQFMK